MTGIELAEVRDTIAPCFSSVKHLDDFLFTSLNYNRPLEVVDGSLNDVVLEVLKKFNTRGIAPLLLAKLAAYWPLNDEVQKVYSKYTRGQAAESLKCAVEHERAKAKKQFGLVPTVDFQTSGKRDLQPDEGFERQIRSVLGAFDPAPWVKGLMEQTLRICCIEVDGVRRGTGFLVGPDWVLTNYHVLRELIEAKALASKITCQFGYQRASDGLESEGIRVELSPEWLIDASPPLSNTQESAGTPEPDDDHLDHALIRLYKPFDEVLQSKGKPPRGWVKIPATAPEIVPQMPLLILQHPHGKSVKLAMDTNAVRWVNKAGTRVRYSTNTDNGSSGSPCFDMNWQLVALHHFGEPGDSPTFNQGVPIAAIRRRLERLNNGPSEHRPGFEAGSLPPRPPSAAQQPPTSVDNDGLDVIPSIPNTPNEGSSRKGIRDKQHVPERKSRRLLDLLLRLLSCILLMLLIVAFIHHQSIPSGNPATTTKPTPTEPSPPPVSKKKEREREPPEKGDFLIRHQTDKRANSFYPEDKIKETVNDRLVQYKGEQCKASKLVFSTTNQRTWIAATDYHLILVLDTISWSDTPGREGSLGHLGTVELKKDLKAMTQPK